MRKLFRIKNYEIFRRAFNLLIGFGYVMLTYLFFLFALKGTWTDVRDSALAILLIAICGLGQISQYRDAYKDIHKDFFYYCGVVPPTIALISMLGAVAVLAME